MWLQGSQPPVLPISGTTGSHVVRVGLSTCCFWDEVPSPVCWKQSWDVCGSWGRTGWLCPVLTARGSGGQVHGAQGKDLRSSVGPYPVNGLPEGGWGEGPQAAGQAGQEGPTAEGAALGETGACQAGMGFGHLQTGLGDEEQLGGPGVILGPPSNGCCWEQLERGLGEPSPLAGTALLPLSWAARDGVCASVCKTGTPVLTPSTCTHSLVPTWTPTLCTLPSTDHPSFGQLWFPPSFSSTRNLPTPQCSLLWPPSPRAVLPRAASPPDTSTSSLAPRPHHRIPPCAPIACSEIPPWHCGLADGSDII